MAIIIQYFTTLFGWSEVAALLAAIILLGKDPNKKWRYFIYYMMLVVAVEILGTYTKEIKSATINSIGYNVLFVVQISFVTSVLYNINRFKKFRWLLPAILVLLYSVFIFELQINHWFMLCTFTKFLFSFICTTLCCTFFYGIMQRDEAIDLIKYPKFWIVVGLFAFSFGSSVIYAFYDKIAMLKVSGTDYVYKIVMGTLINILYISWIIAFICRKNQYRNSAS